MAPSSTRESFELADFNAAHLPSASGAPESSAAGARQSRSAGGLFRPATNSQSLAGVKPGPETEQEKQERPNHRPRGTRFTRLRFWAEALRRRAQEASQPRVNRDPETAAKMKFSHSIQFNAVPDWSSNYIAYSNLKKL